MLTGVEGAVRDCTLCLVSRCNLAAAGEPDQTKVISHQGSVSIHPASIQAELTS